MSRPVANEPPPPSRHAMTSPRGTSWYVDASSSVLPRLPSGSQQQEAQPEAPTLGTTVAQLLRGEGVHTAPTGMAARSRGRSAVNKTRPRPTTHGRGRTAPRGLAANPSLHRLTSKQMAGRVRGASFTFTPSEHALRKLSVAAATLASDTASDTDTDASSYHHVDVRHTRRAATGHGGHISVKANATRDASVVGAVSVSDPPPVSVLSPAPLSRQDSGGGGGGLSWRQSWSTRRTSPTVIAPARPETSSPPGRDSGRSRPVPRLRSSHRILWPSGRLPQRVAEPYMPKSGAAAQAGRLRALHTDKADADPNLDDHSAPYVTPASLVGTLPSAVGTQPEMSLELEAESQELSLPLELQRSASFLRNQPAVGYDALASPCAVPVRVPAEVHSFPFIEGDDSSCDSTGDSFAAQPLSAEPSVVMDDLVGDYHLRDRGYATFYGAPFGYRLS